MLTVRPSLRSVLHISFRVCSAALYVPLPLKLPWGMWKKWTSWIHYALITQSTYKKYDRTYAYFMEYIATYVMSSLGLLIDIHQALRNGNTSWPYGIVGSDDQGTILNQPLKRWFSLAYFAQDYKHIQCLFHHKRMPRLEIFKFPFDFSCHITSLKIATVIQWIPQHIKN